MRRRKVTYPPPKTATSGGNAGPAADARAAAAASRAVTINLDAMKGRDAVVQGGRVQITSGIYAGEFAIVESVVGGVIPAAIVRTEAGRTRRARTVDLIPSPISAAPKAAPAAAEEPAPTDPASPD